MARAPNFSPMNFVYIGVGAAVSVGVGYYALRYLRNSRAVKSSEESAMLGLRRATRDVGDSLKNVGKAAKKAGKQAVQEVGYEAGGKSAEFSRI